MFGKLWRLYVALLKVALLLFLATVAYVVMFHEPAPPVQGPPDPAQVAEERRLQARGACREFTKRSLNDPDSAKWEPGADWQVEEVPPDQWRVSPVLRANNGFGALMLITVDCTVRRTESGDWSLVSLATK